MTNIRLAVGLALVASIFLVGALFLHRKFLLAGLLALVLISGLLYLAHKIVAPLYLEQMILRHLEKGGGQRSMKSIISYFEGRAEDVPDTSTIITEILQRLERKKKIAIDDDVVRKLG